MCEGKWKTLKEVIILDAGYKDDDPYVHCCMNEKHYEYIEAESMYEDHKADHFMVVLFTKNNFHGKVRMTLESIEE